MNTRKKNVNDNFFEIINTEEKAYILGFIYADGYIGKRGNSYIIKISLSKKDKQFLEAINKYLSEYSVKEYITKSRIPKSGIIENCEVSFRSQKMFEDLNKKGVFERKSLTLQFPTENQVPKHLLDHFIRGYFDGDGSISVYQYFSKVRNKKYTKIEFNISGTKEFLEGIRDFINLSKKCVYKEKRRNTNCYKLTLVGNKRIEKIYKLLYQNSHLYLSRKRKIFENFMQERRSTTIIDNPEMD